MPNSRSVCQSLSYVRINIKFNIMEGKIFNDSANIYQDQAKVLFEYYKSAAEKIVNEEKSYEEKISNAEYQITKYKEDIRKTKKQRTWAWVLCWTLVGLVIALMKNSRIKELEAMVDEKNREIAGFRKAYNEIFRDYRVTKMGVAYVPVAKRVAYNDKSFIVDQSGVTDKEKFTLQVIKQNELINDAVADLQNLSKSAPIVESSTEPEPVNTSDLSKSIQKVNFNDYFGKLDRTLRTISYSLGNIEEYNVELPVVFPDTEYARFLKDHAATKVDGSPIFNVFDTSQFDGDIRKFNQLNETRKALSNQSEQVDKVLKTLMVDMADAVQSTAAKKVASAGTLVEYSNRILFNILKAPYNFYSPVLEADEIERIRNEKFDYESVDYSYKPFNLRDSSKVKLDIRSMSWVADDGSRTNVPFGVNQIQYEVIAPIVSNLLKDTRKERIEIYNHIKDQKLSYLNKWHQDTEDFYGRNRAEAADIINLMRSTLSEYSAAYNTLAAYKKTEESMTASQTLESAVTEAKDNSAEVLAGYQAQAQQVTQTQQEFSDYMDRLHEDIDARAEKFGYVEYYDASLRDKRARDTAVAANNVNLLDERRKPLAEVSPLLAQNSELPPEPSIEQAAYEFAGINLNAVAKEALAELHEVEFAQSSHSVNNVSEPENEPEPVEDLVVEPEDDTEEEVFTSPEDGDEGFEDIEDSEDVDDYEEEDEEYDEEEPDEEYEDDEEDVEDDYEEGEEELEEDDEEEVEAEEEQEEYIEEEVVDEEQDEDVEEEAEVAEEEAPAPAKVSVGDIEQLVEYLLEEDMDDEYGVQAVAANLMTLMEHLKRAKGDERSVIEMRLAELYNDAKGIEAELKKSK